MQHGRCRECDRDMELDKKGHPTCFACVDYAWAVMEYDQDARDRERRDSEEIKDAMKAKGKRP